MPVTQADFTVFTTTLAAIPRGYYTSYGQLARLCGVHVRQVQAWLRRLPPGTKLPWHRVINSQRRITAHQGAAEQYQRLAGEGLLPQGNGRFPITRYWPEHQPAANGADAAP